MIKVKANINNEAKGAKAKKKHIHKGIPVYALIKDEVLDKLNALKLSLMPKNHKRHNDKNTHGEATKGHRVYSSKKKTMHFAPGRTPTVTAAS